LRRLKRAYQVLDWTAKSLVLARRLFSHGTLPRQVFSALSFAMKLPAGGALLVKTEVRVRAKQVLNSLGPTDRSHRRMYPGRVEGLVFSAPLLNFPLASSVRVAEGEPSRWDDDARLKTGSKGHAQGIQLEFLAVRTAAVKQRLWWSPQLDAGF
jgi:hypothetical protein